MTHLKIANDYAFLEADDKTKKKLWKQMRFRERNYFHNRRYKQKMWDGYCDFFKLDNGKFLTGLLPEVKAALNYWGVEYTVQDTRTPVVFQHTNINKDFLKLISDPSKPTPNVELYDYQVDYINAVTKHHRGVIYSPTGSGKSLSMVGVLKTLPVGLPTLIVQNRASLAQQNYDEICSWDFPRVGTLWGGKCKPDIITVATVQSIKKLDKILHKFRAIIVDEIHDMMSTGPKAMYRKLTGCSVRVAMSATPFKFGDTDQVHKYYVKGFFGPVLKTKATASGILTTNELQKRDILSQSHCTFYPIKEPMIPHDVYMDAVTRGIAESYHFHQVVSRLAKLQKGRTLILVDRIAHGDSLHGLLPNSLWVRGEDTIETRKSVIQRLQKDEGDVVAIATQQVFNTGINCKVHTLINAAGGQADHQIIQRMGRGLRTADDKDILQYYDFLFLINDYLEKHSRKRIKILKDQGHEIVLKDEIDF
jgi:superfamily II DNA or RNA helicase